MNFPRADRRPPGNAAAGWYLSLLLFWSGLASGYEPAVHQKLTFHAAKLFNSCAEQAGSRAFTPLQVRYIANANVALADSNFLVRMFRWSYYDRDAQHERSALWLINTRMHGHFNRLVEAFDAADEPEDRYRFLGGIAGYLQLMTSPARVVPVYTVRFWRWSFSDRFDNYRMDDEALEQALDDDCGFLQDPPENFQQLLVETADATLQAVRSPIGGLPATWESFWEISDDPNDFGQYGPAGNSFGRKASFPCNDPEDGGVAADAGRCVLLKRDPIYAAFALERHAAAIRSTARAMLILQRLVPETEE